MSRIDNSTLAHVECALLAITRVGDVMSTRLATPTLRLESNPIAKRLGWPFLVASLLICVIPYYSTSLGMTAIVVGALVCFSNFSKLWRVRTMGEVETEALMLRLARTSTLKAALIPHWIAQSFLAAIGVILLFVSGGPTQWAFWIALGIVLAPASFALYGTAHMVRLFRAARGREEA
jgi:hypothetical protein